MKEENQTKKNLIWRLEYDCKLWPGAELNSEFLAKYGHTISKNQSSQEISLRNSENLRWVWDTKALENASESDLWKIAALSFAYENHLAETYFKDLIDALNWDLNGIKNSAEKIARLFDENIDIFTGTVI